MVAAAYKPAGKLEFNQVVAALAATSSTLPSSSTRLPLMGWSDDEWCVHSALRDEAATAALDCDVAAGDLAPDHMLVWTAMRHPGRTTAATFLSFARGRHTGSRRERPG